MTKDVEAWPLELSSFNSVRKFADSVESEGFPIDALIANAAVGAPSYAKTEDGWETAFVLRLHLVQLFRPDSLSSFRLQVNYLSTVLLSILMLPHLIKSATPTNASRLVIVSSSVHFGAKLEGAANWPSILGTLNDEEYCKTTL